jgi:signal transduction histidine kinase
MTPVAALTPLVWIAAAAACAALTVSHFRLCRCRAMVAQAVHELRAPITAARLALDGLNPSTRVAAADLELRRAARALDDLAAAPAGRRARDAADTVDLGAVLTEAAESWQRIAVRHGADLRLDLPPQPLIVGADPLRLLQACGNLVANACEHGGGSVRMRARRSDQRVRIEVTDTGPGLPAPVADLVRAAHGRRTRRGHGLALAAAIAERHGGFVRLRTVVDLPAEGARELPKDHDPMHELTTLTEMASALLAVRGATAFFLPGGEALRSRQHVDSVLRRKTGIGPPPVELWANLRTIGLGAVGDARWVLVDVVGMRQLRLPDQEALFVEDKEDPAAVASLLMNACFHVVAGRGIADGSTSDDGRGRRWKASQATSVLLPSRPVVRWLPEESPGPNEAMLARLRAK